MDLPTKDDFTLEEDGHPQTIRYFSQESGQPLTLGLLLDTSISQRRVLGEERTSSLRFLSQVLRPDKDRAFVIHFDRVVELLQDLTSSRENRHAGLFHPVCRSRCLRRRLRRLERQEGAAAHRWRNRGQLPGSLAKPISTIYMQLEEELRDQYSVGYTSDGTGTGYRKIRLPVKRPGLLVETRDGYYATR